MNSLGYDLRCALRSLIKSGGFSLPAILTLALGIGATTAIFSVVNAVLLQPLPFPDSERLVQVWETRPGEQSRAAAPANYLDWREEDRSFADLAAYDLRAGSLLGGDGPERLNYATVSTNFFRTLGVHTSKGRTFLPDDSSEATPRTAVLSHDLWQRRFSGDPEVIGRLINLDGQTFTVVGVMPRPFDFPAGAKMWLRAPFDVPGIAGFPGDITRLRDAWYFRVVGRLADRIELAGAQAAMDVLSERLEAEHPVSNLDAGVRLVPLRDELTGEARTLLFVLLGAVGFVLLIACTNVANLVLVRMSRRSRELAVRTALGAGRARLVSHLLAESLVLGLGGGVLGLAIAYGAVPVLVRLIPATALVPGQIGVDGAVLSFSIALSIVAALAFGTFPALAASRTDPGSALTQRNPNASGRGAGRTRGALVVVQCALALMLLLGASLMLRSLWQLQQVDPGFRPDDLQTLQLTIPGSRPDGQGGMAAFYEQVIERIDALPGVVSSAVATSGPMDDGPGAGLRIEDRPAPEGALPNASWQTVSPGYFRTAGIALLRGRGFNEIDRREADPVAVVNRALAERHWPGENPLGRRINTGLDGAGLWITIIGVVEDTKNEGLAGESTPEMFRPITQPSRGFDGSETMLLIRSTSPAATLMPAVRRAVWSLRPEIPIFDIRSGDDLLTGSSAQPRAILWLLGVFAGLALTLAAVGIYGVLSHTVNQRSHEIGVRMALGARGSEVVRMILGGSLKLVLTGLGLGLSVALVTSRALRGLLFEVSATDPAAYAAAALVLLGVGLAAAYLPARRAARIAPVDSLRED